VGSIVKSGTIAVLALLLIIATTGVPAPEPGAAGNTAPRVNTSGTPERPRSVMTVEGLPAPARTVKVRAGESLQRALDSARPGDAIALEPGAEFRGPFRLRALEGNGWVVIRPDVPDSELPVAGTRVGPSQFARMPRLISTSGSVIQADKGAHHIRLIGLQIAPARDTFLRALVDLGGGADDLASLPHDLIIDRCYLRGDPRRGSRRGVALNSSRTAIVDSYFADFKEVGADSQAIGGWNGPGPYTIANNYLEAAGENVMFGGADPSINELVPSDITIVRNVFTKPLRWKADRPGYEGVAWTVKNLFELKNARRVLVEGNLFEYNWPQAQNGFAILFTVRNQDGASPWSVVEDVTFAGNVVRHVAAGFNILGHDDNHPSRQTSRIAIRDNVFADIGGEWGHGRLFQVLDGTRDIVIDHNTALQSGSLLFGGDNRPHVNFVFQNNIVHAGPTGISGSDAGEGLPALERYFPGAVIRRNVIIGGDRKRFPADNFFPTRVDEVGSRPQKAGDPFVKLAARYAGVATDGRDPGAQLGDLPAVSSAETSVPVRLDDDVSTAALVPLSTLPSVPEWLFWLSLLVLAYIFIGYPILARIRAAFRPLTRERAPIEPAVTIVVAAYNEADRIERRVQNLLTLDYPADRVEILIGSDGSTDDTVARARAAHSDRVVAHGFAQRRGKPAVLNALVPQASGEIVVFADARQQFDRAALRALVANFADPRVGAVSGELVMISDEGAAAGGEGAAMYWRYEKLIRSTESRGGSTVGATGAIYAIRKALFEPLPEDTILDDVLIPIRIARRGYQVVFEPGAKAFDTPASAEAELVRKVRTISGNFQLFARERWLLNPRANPLWFETVSHKLLRLAIPVLLAALLVTNLAIIDWWPYQVTLAGQAAFYLAALAGYGFRHTRRRRTILTLPYTMCLLSWATIVGFVRFVTDAQSVTWEKLTPSKIRSHS
jgi:cellulose synthase/poly-beta-1,6-N-acetylglucosamine synthase-like glycosyltransferase